MIDLVGPGHVICDRYRVMGPLGKGGMGVVLKAEDTALKRLVALKVTTIRNALTDDDADPLREERFLREASLSAQLHHPNVVTVFDYGRGEHGVETFCYIAMQLLSGETLGTRLNRNPGGLPAAEALSIITQVARGLRAAHQKGLVHRDLKPDNIMLVPGEDGEELAILLDFGLAKDTSPSLRQELTDAGTILGTPEYMSPEQVEGGQIDARSDLYSLGIVLYECLSGLPPFTDENAFKVVAAHLRREPPPLRIPMGRPPPSRELFALVSSLLSKRRDARIQSAEVLLKRLRDLPESKAVRDVAEAPEVQSFATSCHYQAGRKLSESSRATVHDATHMELGRQVAVKVFRTTSPNQIARLARELPSLAVLRHPSNARVLDVGVTEGKPNGRPFLVMERVRGPTLASILAKDGALPWRRAASIGIALLDGLAEAHAVGILHRHLTPEHVLVPGADTRRESVKILSYRVGDSEADGSGPALPLLPHPRYFAPELARGGAYNERCDLYAAAVVLHEMILGRPPQMTDSASRVRVSPVAEVPPDVIDVLKRALATDPRARYDSAAELANALVEARSAAATSRDLLLDGPMSMRRQAAATGLPTLWCLTGDPALHRPAVVEALDSLRGAMRIEEVSADQRERLAVALTDGESQPPWIVLFGGMHVILEDPLLTALAPAPEVSRLMISTHANAEILDAAINFCGMDQHVTLPSSAERVREAILRMTKRSGLARQYCDELRAAGTVSRPTPLLPVEPAPTSIVHREVHVARRS